MNGKRFTQHEIDEVVRRYQTETAVVIGRDLNRSANSVASVAKRYNVQKIDSWTYDEMDYLIKMYPVYRTIVVARTLGKTVNSVAARAKKLKLKVADYV